MTDKAKSLLPIAVALLLANSAMAGRVSKETQVNPVSSAGFSTNKQNEPTIAQNPTNPSNLIVGANDQSFEPGCQSGSATTPPSCPRPPGISVAGFYATMDGGETWCNGLIDLSTANEYAFGDPGLAFDSRGSAYYVTLGIPNPLPTSNFTPDIFVVKSTDGGCHFPKETAAKVSGSGKGIADDKNAIAADANPSSLYRDNIYVAWTKIGGSGNANQIMFARSTDGAKTWSNPVSLSPSDSSSTTYRSGAAIQVSPNGNVYVIWVDTKANNPHPASIHLNVSQDGGKTFLPQGRDITVAELADNGAPFLPGTSFRDGARVFPSFTIAPNGGALHVAWISFAKSSSYPNGHAVVLTTHSTDLGMTWSNPIVAADQGDRNAFFASIAADRDDKVNLIFQSVESTTFPPGAGVVKYDTYFAQSTNGGGSFSLPLRVSGVSSDPDVSSTQGLAQQFLGDYIGAVSDSQGGRVYGVWTDGRHGGACSAVDAFRKSPATTPIPDVTKSCSNLFGDTDIYLAAINY